MGTYIISIAKTTSKETGAFNRTMNFFSREVALYFFKSSIFSCTEYCCHVGAGASSYCMEILDKLQKWTCRTVDLLLAASLKPSAHLQNVASLSLL